MVLSLNALFHGPNAGYMLELYERYCESPALVDDKTRALFDMLLIAHHEPSAHSEDAEQPQSETATTVVSPSPEPTTSRQYQSPSAFTQINNTDGMGNVAPLAVHSAAVPDVVMSLGEVGVYDIPDIVSAARLVRFIREIGHLDAQVDPLGSKPPSDPGLRLESQGLTHERLANLPASVVRSPIAQHAATALEAIEAIRAVYCGAIGYDDNHVQVHEQRAWVREAAETQRFYQGLDADDKRALLQRLTNVEAFERFLHQAFPGQKRFSIEGNDMLIPMLDSIIHQAATAGTHEVVIGMAHRGRLNVLAHILGKTYSAILAEFQGPNYYNKGTYAAWTGDVKYHLGARRAYSEGGVFEMPVTLAPNPSHLEAINPVVQGRARAIQERRLQPGEPVQDTKASVPILIHGDASFPGQGVVAETLNMSRLLGYHVGGTIHIIINNQIGFTTDWHDSRSTLYASDLAKGFAIPILHVNADDPVACIAAATMAWAYRERFNRDFLIDLVGYRRWGHNEGDEPFFTQPLMYQNVSSHPTVREIWAQQLIHEGIVTAEQVEEQRIQATNRLQQAQHEVENGGRIQATMAMSVNTLVHRPVTEPHHVTSEQLVALNDALTHVPDDITLLPKLARFLDKRRGALHEANGIDWAHAETLAFASILADGFPIRFTGQDAERGTFSQRHLVLHDIQSGKQYVPLQTFPQAQASFALHNSPLSENAAIGFEYGYSSHAPDVLVLWEAQFGDFCNNAQVFIDQFIASGTAKWGLTPALVLLLPHGYEGQGPEHSSARLERFLQLAADNNIRVVNCTTAAQYYHVLRRQAAMLQSDPRPLILMTPKSLLRNARATSSLTDLAEGKFLPVLPPVVGSHQADTITQLILCSGKIYYDMLSWQEDEFAQQVPQDVAMARIEELYPFPQEDVETILQQYPQLRSVVWMQEEPHNMGAWTYIEPRLRAIIERVVARGQMAITLRYSGRPESASPSEGTLRQHQQEQARILRDAVAYATQIASLS